MEVFHHNVRPEDVPSQRFKWALLRKSHTKGVISKGVKQLLNFIPALKNGLSQHELPKDHSSDLILFPDPQKNDEPAFDMVFSNVPMPPKKRRKRGVRPPPSPAAGNVFQVHTPPPTPGRSFPAALPALTRADALISPLHRFSFQLKDQPDLVVTKEAHEGFANAVLHGQALGQPEPTHALFSTLTQSPEPSLLPLTSHPDCDWEDAPEVTSPDATEIKQRASRYFPILVSCYAAASNLPMRCATKSCSQHFNAYYACDTCFSGKWYCRECTVNRHEELPFHRIQKWDAVRGFKVPTSLADLGLVMQLVHEDGLACQDKSALTAINTRSLRVLHIDGRHRFLYRLCSCRLSGQRPKTASPEQLVANKLFPATHAEPSQAFTFDLLHHYDVLDLTGFINIKQFCDSVLDMGLKGAMSDVAAGRLRRHFHEAVRYWRLFRIMMNAGFSSYEAFLTSNAMGTCPACPQPGINIPENWQEHEYRDLLYAVFISGDGNFHLSSLIHVQDLLKDPSLFGDAGAWVPYDVYHKYVKAASGFSGTIKDEACGSQAGTPFRDRPCDKYSVAGVAGIQCKHGLWRPNGVADIPKGERFAIVDVPFLIQLQREFKSGITQIVWMYDVNCKYHINSYNRAFSNPYSPLEPMYQERLKDSKFILYLVNVWHQNSHRPECSDKHALRYTRNTGMVGGEEVETAWKTSNNLEYYTREMNAGARADAITVHFIKHNQDKIERMGKRLEERHYEAVGAVNEHRTALRDLELSLNQVNNSIVRRYYEQYEASGGEQFRPNSKKFNYPTKSKVLYKLRMEEETRPSSLSKLAGVSVSDLVSKGLAWEDKWYQAPTSGKKADGKISQLREERFRYMETVVNIFPRLNGISLPDETTGLPSAYPSEELRRLEHAGWAEAELQLRVAEGHELLEQLRTAVGLHLYLIRKVKQSRGTAGMKRVSGQQASASKDKGSLISAYVRNWNKISLLLSSGFVPQQKEADLLKGLQKLDAKTDVNFFEEWGSQTGSYMGHRELNVTWIWRIAMQGMQACFEIGKDDSEIQSLTRSWEGEARRLVWLHAFARSERWKEELLLVREEIRRVGAWYRYHLGSMKDRIIEQEKVSSGRRFARGEIALLRLNLCALEARYDVLPEAFKSESWYTGESVLLFSKVLEQLRTGQKRDIAEVS